MRKFDWILGGVVIFVLLAAGGFVIWGSTPMRPLPEAIAAMQSDDQVQVDTKLWRVFRPVKVELVVGLVLYPGARVDPRAYALPGAPSQRKTILWSLFPYRSTWRSWTRIEPAK